MRKTRKKSYNFDITIKKIMIRIFWILLLIIALIFVIKEPIKVGGFFQKQSEKQISFMVIGSLLVFFISVTIAQLHGNIKGKFKIVHDQIKLNEMNPYIYYRDLPNQFGIGVNSLLMDSTLENEKDIVAAILDLCAKKYIYLNKEEDKYKITIIKNIDGNLLSNEIYILDLLIHNNIQNVDYKKWYNRCMYDGIDLGLYTDEIQITNRQYKKSKLMENKHRIHLYGSIFSAIISIVIMLPKYNFSQIILGVALAIILVNFLLAGFFYLWDILGVFGDVLNDYTDKGYNSTLNKQLTKTQKGIEELQKLYSFQRFIKDFGMFAAKNPEEIVLWDHYLSYAHVFGLTKKIMKSGYSKLVENVSFNIDSIDNIRLYNIETK